MTTESLQGVHLLAGRLFAGSGKPFTAFDPTVAAPIEPTYHEATDADIDAALTAAAAAFEPYNALPTKTRASFLRAIAAELEAAGDALLQRAALETALPIPRVTGERARTTGQLRAFADLIEEGSWKNLRIDTAKPDRQPLPKPDLRRTVVPLGPVVVFGSSNFPFAYAGVGGDTASALAAGCPAVFKGHPGHPGTSELTRGRRRPGDRKDGRAGRRVREHPRRVGGDESGPGPSSADVGGRIYRFTASGAGALFDAAAARAVPIPVYAEMGSVNPVFLLPGALEARPADLAGATWASLTMGVGQFCTSPGVIVARAGWCPDEFHRRRQRRRRHSDTGRDALRGARADIFKGPPGSRRSSGRAGDRRARSPRRTPSSPVRSRSRPRLSSPTNGCVTSCSGPSTVIVAAESDDELLAVAKSFDGQLTASVHGTAGDFAVHADVVTALTRVAGRVIFNGFPTGVEVCPSMQHGGPYPASTDGRTTSVGTAAIDRFVPPGRLSKLSARPAAARAARRQSAERLAAHRWRVE